MLSQRAFTRPQRAVPAGVVSALYSVQAVRGTDVSLPSATLTVLFGNADETGATSAAA